MLIEHREWPEHDNTLRAQFFADSCHIAYRFGRYILGRNVMTNDERPDETDETRNLLLKVEAGDPRAFDELLARHRPSLYRVVVRRLGSSLRGRMDPSDVVQEAQIDAINRLAEYFERRPMPFRAWLLRTAAQRLLKLRRHATAARRDVGRERPLPEGDSSGASRSIAAVGPTPSQQLAARDLASRLHTVLDRLPEADRAILRMRALDGLSYEEAGARLEIDPAAARKRYGRALLRLRALLLADGLTESHL
jgi:RNA polymerase sigma-70 factor, ECF subfamily